MKSRPPLIDTDITLVLYSLENRTKMKPRPPLIDTNITLVLCSLENRAKMKSGVPLTDEDREPWLKTLARYSDVY